MFENWTRERLIFDFWFLNFFFFFLFSFFRAEWWLSCTKTNFRSYKVRLYSSNWNKGFFLLRKSRRRRRRNESKMRTAGGWNWFVKLFRGADIKTHFKIPWLHVSFHWQNIGSICIVLYINQTNYRTNEREVQSYYSVLCTL